MAATRPSSLGFSSASKVAREGGDLEVTVQTAEGPRVFTLPWFFVRDVDALLERWRREEHEATLLNMNAGNLGATLLQAARLGALRDSTFLLARGADVTYQGGGPWTALNDASRNGHLAVVIALLDAGAGRIGSALHSASMGGRTPVVALLLDRGADIHYGNDASLQTAALHGHLETVRLLLDRGADIHAENDGAVRWARERGHEAVAALLRARGAIEDF